MVTINALAKPDRMCERDGSGKPAAKRGLGANSPVPLAFAAAFAQLFLQNWK
ncbi:MAG: hypothetical protein M3R08_00190 [Bacteroidota bacterium]|nr:hypothetical protein [Bacteroidota bacterium]